MDQREITVFQAMQIGLEHHQAGRLSAAESIYQQVLKRYPNEVTALHLLGVIAHQVGKNDIAVQLIGTALSIKPDYAEALCNRGLALQALGRFDEALKDYEVALSINSDYAEAFSNRGNILHQRKRYDEALKNYDRAIAIKPDYAEALYNRGNAMHGLRRYDEALASYDRALSIKPEFCEACSNRGATLHALRRYDESLTSCYRAIAIQPDYADARYNCGNALQALKHYDEALASYDKAILIKPNYVEAFTNRGNVLWEVGRFKESIGSYEKALSINPDYVEALANYGNALKEQGRLDEALSSLAKALSIKPDFAEALAARGSAFLVLKRFEEAEASFDSAIAFKPDYAEAYSNRGNVLKEQGRLEDALAGYRKALSIEPEYYWAQSNVIFVLDLMEGRGVQEQQQERHRWYENHGRKHADSIRSHDNDVQIERRLRIGYVSADFRRHAASYAFAPILRLHDRAAFEVVCYAGNVVEDDVTTGLRQVAEQWRSTLGLSDEKLVEQIRHDQIDILVDLSSHMAGNRLLVFARKPAPVQVSAWGYPNGTGMPTIDYLFADPVVIPSEERSLFAEEVIDLPCFLCYEPPGYLPEVAPQPALAGHPFTFGCISRIEKISDGVLHLWGRILEDVPEARLLVKGTALEDPELGRRFVDRLSAVGIAEARVHLIGQTSHVELLHTFDRIDLALDPFPHGGAIGTAEALWMGVPVVTIRGATFMSRISASILSALGMPEWIANNEEDYVRLAVRASRDLEGLARTRAEMRTRLAGSIFGNARSYTRAVETAYRNMWRRWCEKTQGGSKA